MPDQPDRPIPVVAPPGSDRQVLDLRGLRCPLPVLHTKRALARLAAGSAIDVRCSDPLASLDIPHLLRETGDELLASRELNGEMVFSIRKGPREDERSDASRGGSIPCGRR